MFELPVLNGKNRPTTLASQFGGSGKRNIFLPVALSLMPIFPSSHIFNVENSPTFSPTLSCRFTPLLIVRSVSTGFFSHHVSPETCGHHFCTSSCLLCRCVHPIPSVVAVQWLQGEIKVDLYGITAVKAFFWRPTCLWGIKPLKFCSFTKKQHVIIVVIKGKANVDRVPLMLVCSSSSCIWLVELHRNWSCRSLF